MYKHLIRLMGITFLICIGVFTILGSGSMFPCGPDQVRETCTGGGYITYCCKNKNDPTSCCLIDKGYAKLSQVPRPDLSYTNLDGLVDFGRSKLKIDIASDGDYLETNLKGRVAIVGGICPQQGVQNQCPLQVVLAELRPIKNNLTTAKGRTVTGLFVRNANTWKGKILSDGTIDIDSTSKLAFEAFVEEKDAFVIANSSGELKGSLYYNASRLTETGPRKNNLIEISGEFIKEDIKVSLTISIWATNCESVVEPTAQCRSNIESGLPGYVYFDSNFKMLGNLQASQDLCDALLASKYEVVCDSGGTVEFPTFSCNKQPLPPPSNKVEVAKLLKFQWKNAKGTVLSDQYSFYLDRMPVFPVTLTVENKWGKIVSATLKDAPVCTSDVELEPGACAWMELPGPLSHQRNDNWCPDGSFLTALDLQGDASYSAHDAPLIGYARCCTPTKAQRAKWASCSWTAIGRRSHQQNASWCADNAFLTALDLDSDGALSAHDSPIVGHARCCTPAGPTPSETMACSWVKVGRRSHQRGGNWCPTGSYIVALDLDSDGALSAHDSPIVGSVLCCPLGN